MSMASKYAEVVIGLRVYNSTKQNTKQIKSQCKAEIEQYQQWNYNLHEYWVHTSYVYQVEKQVVLKVKTTVTRSRIPDRALLKKLSQNLQRCFDEVNNDRGHVNNPQSRDLQDDNSV